MKNKAESTQTTPYWKIATVVLLATNLITGAYAVMRQEVNLMRDAPYPLIDPTRNFIPQDDFIVNLQPLREELRAKAREIEEEGARVSLYLEFLNTGANISINPDVYIWPASLAKVPLAMAVMKKVERGEWELTDKLVLMEVDRDIHSGDANDPLLEHPLGTRFTIDELLKELLANSDNTAYRILLRNVHNDDVDEVIQELGLGALFTPEGRMSAKEYSRILRALYTSSFLSREHSQMLLSYLDESSFNDFLAREIPPDVPFPHKYGENLSLRVFADSGIVYIPKRPYLVSVMVEYPPSRSQEESAAKARVFMGAVSKSAYEYFSAQ
ncbi:MAG TPA: serine hydrolase [Candidatus Paceibacterota bacterium]|nr:serine hydrolase [Candidatus Paceibacterota bacterium]